jgi:hypothetical protein
LIVRCDCFISVCDSSTKTVICTPNCDTNGALKGISVSRNKFGGKKSRVRSLHGIDLTYMCTSIKSNTLFKILQHTFRYKTENIVFM